MTDRDDGERDDPQLQSLRAVWLAMPDEEPPQRGLAELMAAARVKAEEMAKPSAWQRFVALLRRPPVLALASAMVLIGGAVFVTSRKDKLEAPPPSIAVERAQEEMEAAPLPPAPASNEAPAAAATGSMIAVEVPEPILIEPEPESEPRPARRRPARVAPKTEIAKEKGAATADVRRLDDEARDIGTSALASPAPMQDSVSTAKVGGAQQAPLAQLARQARGAAARGDCAGAKANLERIRETDAAYYKRVVDGDAALKRCLAL